MIDKIFRKRKHAIYSLKYDLVQYTDKNNDLINGEDMVNSLKENIQKINKTFDVKLKKLNIEKNNFILTFETKPSINLPHFVAKLKTQTSKELRKKFPILSALKDKLWAPNYFISTLPGNVDMEDRQEYIKSQSKTITKTRSNSYDRLRKPSIA